MKPLNSCLTLLLILALAACTAAPAALPTDAQPPTAAPSPTQPAAPQATLDPLTATPAAKLYALPLHDPINLRSGPGTSYPILGYAQAGDRLLVLGRSPDQEWIKVAYAAAPDGFAWVYQAVVTLSQETQP